MKEGSSSQAPSNFEDLIQLFEVRAFVPRRPFTSHCSIRSLLCFLQGDSFRLLYRRITILREFICIWADVKTLLFFCIDFCAVLKLAAPCSCFIQLYEANVCFTASTFFNCFALVLIICYAPDPRITTSPLTSEQKPFPAWLMWPAWPELAILLFNATRRNGFQTNNEPPQPLILHR
jgi:hypothetical protein